MRNHWRRSGWLVGCALMLAPPAEAQNWSEALLGAPARTPEEQRLRECLVAGRLQAGVDDWRLALERDPHNDRLRFGLGLLQFLRAGEQLAQSWYRYGLRAEDDAAGFVPFLRLVIPPNPEPETIRHADARRVLADLQAGLIACEATLAGIQDDAMELSVPVGLIRMDIDGDGECADEECMARVYAALLGRGANRNAAAAPLPEFLIRFDAGDVRWLRGYCHLLNGMLDFWLAHDDAALFASTAHLFFPRPATPYTFLVERRPSAKGRPDVMETILDAAAFIHLLNLPVSDAGRMRAAREHFQRMTALSRESWQLIMAETDDNQEWIPNPRQQSVIPGARVTEPMVAAWQRMLDELDAILEGRKLAPFWRGTARRGINVARFFEEPRTFDLVLLIQGTGAAPYLEDGPVTESAFWENVLSAFGRGGFFPYAIWFN